MALQQAVGLSVPSPRSCGLYSSIPNVIVGIPRFSIVFHWSFLLSASSFIGVSPSKSLSFYTAKVYGCCGNERVPAYSLCPEKITMLSATSPTFFSFKTFLIPPSRTSISRKKKAQTQMGNDSLKKKVSGQKTKPRQRFSKKGLKLAEE